MAGRTFLLLFILVFTAFSGVYTLEELLITAIHNSKELRSMELELKKADAHVLEITGRGLPQISASLNINHGNNFFYIDDQRLQNSLSTNLQSSDISDKQLAESILSQSLSLAGEMMLMPENAVTASLDVKQVIFAQGKVRLGKKVAKAYHRTLLCKYNFEKMKLKSEIMSSFYSAVLAQKNVTICTEAVMLAEQTHRLAVITHLVGRVSELDTLSSLFNLEKARIELQKAQSSLRTVYQAIMTRSGISEELSGFSVDGEFEQTVFTLSIDSVLALVHRKNPDIIKLQGAEEIQDNLVRIARGEFYPAIYAGASVYGYGFFNDASDIFEPGLGNESRVYVGLSWDIFTGLSKIYKLKQAEAEREKFRISRQKVIETLELQARNAYEQVHQSNINLLSTRSLIQLAEKRYLIARKAFEVGSKTILDVQNAEFELNSAKMSLNAAQFSFQNAIISLKLLMGDI